MITFLRKLFIDNWKRKFLSIIFASFIWLFVNHFLITTKTISKIPIKIINLDSSKTIKGISADGILKDTISLTILGHQKALDEITNEDIIVSINMKDRKEDYLAYITKNNLISKNPNLNIEKDIKKVTPETFNIKLSNFVEEKIPVFVKKPNGKTPQGYSFFNIWPDYLYTTLSGPEEIIRPLKNSGINLTLNLDNITKEDLDIIEDAQKKEKRNVISYFLPTSWKTINLPEISNAPIEIDDEKAKTLRIDFIKENILPLNYSIPILLFFPPSNKLSSQDVIIENNDFIKTVNGTHIISCPLYAQDVNETFLNIFKEKLFILITPEENKNTLTWSLQGGVSIKKSKNVFIKKLLLNTKNKNAKEQHLFFNEEYLGSKFEAFRNKFKLYLTPTDKLDLDIKLKDNKITILPKKAEKSADLE